MYGKHFESMYEGSMYGAGVAVFAVWGYVISHTRDSHVELNPKRLADTLGGTVEEITEAINKLQQPDPESRHKEFDGRRLIKDGEFQYKVPSWEFYAAIKNEADRRAYNREAKRRERARRKIQKLHVGPTFVAPKDVEENGSDDECATSEHATTNGTSIQSTVFQSAVL